MWLLLGRGVRPLIRYVDPERVFDPDKLIWEIVTSRSLEIAPESSAKAIGASTSDHRGRIQG